MHPSAASLARGVAIAIVLILAAIAGLVVGNALDSRNRSDLAQGAGPVFADVRGNIAAEDAAAGAPNFADPYRLHMEQDGADADPVGPETYGNIVEESNAATESLTAPTLR